MKSTNIRSCAVSEKTTQKFLSGHVFYWNISNVESQPLAFFKDTEVSFEHIFI